MLEISYISVCSGIEAASVAMSRIEGVNWRPVAFSEIDAFPCAVLAHHYKALGNSWATNCAEWILRRVVAAFRLGMC